MQKETVKEVRIWVWTLMGIFALFIIYKWIEKPLPTQEKVTITPQTSQPIVIEGAKWSPTVTQPPINVSIPKSNDSLTVALINALNRLNAVKDYDTTVTAISGSDTTGTAKVHIRVTDNSVSEFRLGLQTFNKTIEHTLVTKFAVSLGAAMTYKQGVSTPYYIAGLQLPKMSYELGKEIGGNAFFVSGKICIFSKRK